MSRHQHYESISTTTTARGDEELIDSAATTLLHSPTSDKSHSLDGDRQRYADLEFRKYDERERLMGQDGREGRSRVSVNDEESDDDEDGTEDTRLVDPETTIVNNVSVPAEAARGMSDDPLQPPPGENAAGDGDGTAKNPERVSWSSLPKKSQLAILTLARLSEPLTQTSLQSYMFYQLKSFHTPGAAPPSDATVASQTGFLAAAFTGAQFCTALMWGRLADSERLGRKRVILIGLLGTAIGSLGFGFSRSFAAAVAWRVVGGMLNGNMGVMRTMISEIVRERKYLSRAFLLLPMTFNVGVIIGPLLGGILADPVGSYPGVFGPGGSIGGKDGVAWLMRWPYALPNVVNAVFLTCSALGVIFGLEETLEGLRERKDYGLEITRWILRAVFRRRRTEDYAALAESEGAAEAGDIEMCSDSQRTRKEMKKSTKRKLPFRRIWTTNFCLTLLAHGLLAMHVGTFNNLWFVFLSTPRYNPKDAMNSGHRGGHHPHPPRSPTTDDQSLTLPPNYHPHPPFTFTGGLALPPPSIGTALAILGVIGISLQLLLYPRLSFYFGTTKSFRGSLCLFPFSYFLAPFLALLHSSTPPPGQATGAIVWIGITLLLAIQVTARTFALPSSAILVNNASPHPSVLGTVHGIAQSVSSASRTVAPVVAGWAYGTGLRKGVVGLAWWGMACVAIVGAVAGQWVREGDGHEIWLEGEEREEVKDG